MAFLNIIVKALWPILVRLFKPDIKNQNYYNHENTEKKAKRSDKEPKDVEGKFVWPVINAKHRITSPFGYRKLRGRRRFHYGIDVIGSTSYNVCAAENGVVVKILPPTKTPARWAKKDGKWVRLAANINSPTPYILINAWNGTQQLYAHVKASITVGKQVAAGDKIGTYKPPAKPKHNGGYGNSFGAHLHFEVRKKIRGKFKQVDPKRYADSRVS